MARNKSNVWWEQSHVMQGKGGMQQQNSTQQIKRLVGAIICNVTERWHATSQTFRGSNHMQTSPTLYFNLI